MAPSEDQASSRIVPGTRIDAYRIDSELARGGMGVIYAATDTKLDRRVAIKFLSNELADAGARRRFQREAQLASSLNHPHILTIYDVGELGDQQYLVMEFVDGGTLKEWAAREHPSWRQTVETLIGVADGLAAAHDAGILHRDIKPDNILVAKNGYAKLADFGIAKLVEADPAAQSATTAVTRIGAIVGSPGYMSPEQTSGGKVDVRSDVFSFGVVLYEFLSGARPFTGASDVDVGRAVIHGPMPPLPSELPSALQMIVEKALEKDPADRYQTMRDFVVDLRRLARRQIGATGTQQPQVPSSRPSRLAGPALVLLLLVAAIGGSFWVGRQMNGAAGPASPAAGATTYLRVTEFVGMEEMPAVSPDGRTVAFASTTNGRRQIWQRLLAGGPPSQLTSDGADHEHPRWAPDGNSVIYFVPAEDVRNEGALWEVPALGGAPRRVADSLGGADISHDGERIAVVQTDDGDSVLAILNRDGSSAGPPLPLPDGIDYQPPRWSPDDGFVAITVNEGTLNHLLYVIDVTGAAEPILLTEAPDIQGLTWRPDGSGIVYASSLGSTLSYPPVFNLRQVSLDGGERQLTVGDDSYVQPDMTRLDQLFASRVRMDSDIWQIPANGDAVENTLGAEQITFQTGQVQTPSVSSDGSEIAYLSDSGGHSNLWVSSIDRSSEPRQITFEDDPDVIIGIPRWSPTVDRILFIRTIRAEESENHEWLINPDTSDRTYLTPGVAAAWSADGQWVYFTDLATACVNRISADGGTPERIRCEANNLIASPDARTVYFFPSVARQNEIYLASPPDGPARLLASYPIWRIPAFPQGYELSRNGDWLALPLRDGHTTNIWAVSTADGTQRQITDFRDRHVLITRTVSWSPDGEFVYAAVVDTDADIVMIEGLTN